MDTQRRHPLAELLPDGRWAVNPDAIHWEDIDRFHAAMRRGQAANEDAGGFMARCIRALMGTPLPADAAVRPYREAVGDMLREAAAARFLSMPDDEVRAGLIAMGGDPDQSEARVRAVIEGAIAASKGEGR